MQKGQKWLVLVFLVLILFIPASFADAQGSQFPGDTDPVISGEKNPSGIVPCGDADEPSCGACQFVALVQDGINFGVYFSIFVATLMIVFAGFKYVTAGGDSGKVSDAHKIFRTVIVGLIIILAAWLIVDTLMKTFYRGDNPDVTERAGFGPWNEILCEDSTSGTLPEPSSLAKFCLSNCVDGFYTTAVVYGSGAECTASCSTVCRTFEAGLSCSQQASLELSIADLQQSVFEARIEVNDVFLEDELYNYSEGYDGVYLAEYSNYDFTSVTWDNYDITIYDAPSIYDLSSTVFIEGEESNTEAQQNPCGGTQLDAFLCGLDYGNRYYYAEQNTLQREQENLYPAEGTESDYDTTAIPYQEALEKEQALMQEILAQQQYLTNQNEEGTFIEGFQASYYAYEEGDIIPLAQPIGPLYDPGTPLPQETPDAGEISI